MREARFIDDESAPAPVIEVQNGLRMLLSFAMQQYSVEWASDEEREVLGRHGRRFQRVTEH